MNDEEERRRRAALTARVDAIDRKAPSRAAFFDAVYRSAGADAGLVPWADQKPKERLAAWLAGNPGAGRAAIDVACGLGDNAEALAEAGWRTTAFDLSERAVAWARERFPGSTVDYRVADLMALPAPWTGAFDLVHECYTIQSVPGEMRAAFIAAIAGLVAPGGTLLVYARTRPGEEPGAGPPWPLSPSETAAFAGHGLTLAREERFTVNRPDRVIPHLFAVWQRG